MVILVMDKWEFQTIYALPQPAIQRSMVVTDCSRERKLCDVKKDLLLHRKFVFT